MNLRQMIDAGHRGILYVPKALYDAAKAEGYDMEGIEPVGLIPVAPEMRKSAGRTEVPACMPTHGGKCAVCGTGDCLRRP